MVLFLLDTGVCASELVALNVSNLDPVSGPMQSVVQAQSLRRLRLVANICVGWHNYPASYGRRCGFASSGRIETNEDTNL